MRINFRESYHKSLSIFIVSRVATVTRSGVCRCRGVGGVGLSTTATAVIGCFEWTASLSRMLLRIAEIVETGFRFLVGEDAADEQLQLRLAV